jgi:hypothetical protein
MKLSEAIDLYIHRRRAVVWPPQAALLFFTALPESFL